MIVCTIPQEQMREEHYLYLKQRTGATIVPAITSEDRARLIPEAEILLTYPSTVKKYIAKAEKLKWAFCLSAGVEALPFDELKRRGIIVSNASGVHAEQMSEHTLGIMIAFCREFHTMMKNQLEKRWKQLTDVDELSGKTLCVIGTGSVGREIAHKAKAFYMNVIGVKNTPAALPSFDAIYTVEHLHSALKLADYTVLVTPLTEKTYHMIGSKEFQCMKNSAVFINISRGDTVDEEALITALENGWILGAGLDVFHEEPLPPESKLWTLPNVILTPHNSGLSRHYFQKCVELFADAYARYTGGQGVLNRIDLTKGY